MRNPSYGLQLSPKAIIAVVGLCGVCSTLVAAEGTGSFPLVVVVDDRAEVPPRILDQAQREAARIYWQAGVKAEWLTASSLKPDSPDDEDLPPRQKAFTVQLIIQAKLRASRDSTSTFLMGAAPATARDCGGSVYVFYDQVTEFSNVQRLDVALVVGTVLAHEIGHHLLRHHGHSAEGLMRAGWDAGDWLRASSGFLLFAVSEPATIRATISSCRR